MKSKTKAISSCNNLHQVSSRLKGLSLLLQRWHQYVCCYRNLAQHYNGKLLKEFLSPSPSSSILTAKNRYTTSISLDVIIGTYPAKTCCIICVLDPPQLVAWKKKKKLGFQKSNSSLTSLSLYFSAKLDTQVKQSYAPQLAKGKNKRFQNLGSCQLDRTKTWSTLYTKMEEKIKCLSRSHWAATASLQILACSFIIQEHFCALNFQVSIRKKQTTKRKTDL